MFVLLESPYAGNVEQNEKYARECLKDSLLRGEAPFVSHLLYTQVLDDLDPIERQMGIEAGLKIGQLAEKTVVYEDLGISNGMHYGIDEAIKRGRPVEYRRIR
jgi:hypothetical protein